MKKIIPLIFSAILFLFIQHAEAQTQPKTSFGNGMHIVGQDIQPGTYRTAGGENCNYQRLRGFSGEIDDSSSSCSGWTKIQ